ncbi:MAG: TRAP transporter permease, partial [Candidatus Binatia bacterium]
MTEVSVERSRLEAAQEFIQEEAGPRRQLTGAVGKLSSLLAVGMSLVFFYWAWAAVTAQVLRLVFLGFSLVLSFLIYPTRRRARGASVPWHDWLLIAMSIAAVAYPLWDFEEFIYRAALPTNQDQIFGALTIVLVLEATRRTTGWVLPAVAIGFLAYAWLGAYLPPPWTHQGYDLDRMVG